VVTFAGKQKSRTTDTGINPGTVPEPGAEGANPGNVNHSFKVSPGRDTKTDSNPEGFPEKVVGHG